MLTFKQFLASQYRQSASNTIPVIVTKYPKQTPVNKPNK
jgi:hypothetical protein